MATTSLYNRHRPVRFDALVGQEHVTTALRNAVRDDRVGHAYLFSGPRGTGKTTTARILARALNCLDLGDDGEPCGACETCVAITGRTFYDLVEIDAASNRGVDAMRDLIQSVSTGLGATSRRKVYVVDEVHMLTTEASNTLLKTLEEPPEHVVFVLATTDPQKVLPTIRSRAQHFEFRLLTLDELRGHLQAVLEVERVHADDEAIDLVARRAAGSARDALSLLDQALALGSGALDAGRVLSAFGGAPFDRRLEILTAAARDDAAGALAGVGEALAAGISVRSLADDLLRTLRDAFVLSASRGRVAPDETPVDEVDALAALAHEMGPAALVRGIETLGRAIVDVRQHSVADPRLVLEVAVVRLARRDTAPAVDALLDRLERLERRVDELEADARAPRAAPAPSPPTASPSAARGPASALGAHLPDRVPASPEPAPGAASSSSGAREENPPDPPLEPVDVPAPEARPVSPLSRDEVIVAWAEALRTFAPPLRAIAQEAQPVEVDGDVVVFGVQPGLVERTRGKFRAEADTIKAALQAHLGSTPKLQVVADAGLLAEAGAGRPSRTGTDEPPPSDDEPVDVDDLVDVTDGAVPADSTSRLVEMLDAEVVEERPRE